MRVTATHRNGMSLRQPLYQRLPPSPAKDSVQRMGDYHNLATLGEGGMGTVFSDLGSLSVHE